MEALDLLADITAVGRNSTGGWTRTAWDDPTMELREWFVGRCRSIGLEVVEDGNGNQFGWWGTPGAAPALMIGSHLDSVVGGGELDGPLGIASSLAALSRLREAGWRPNRPIAVANFSDEEGARFGVACLGSRLAAGAIEADRALGLRDDDGISLAEAMSARGRDPRSAGPAPWLSQVGSFVELHVEQGRSLVHTQDAVGVASAIWPHGRYRFDFCGQGNHAGATAMADRHDPMLSYAATVLAAAELAGAAGDGLRATFGRLQVSPGSTNSIPSRVSAWLDARAADQAGLERLVESLVRRAQLAADRDGTTLSWRAESVSGAVAFDPGLRQRLATLLEAPVMATGAGHDAGVLAARFPTAMIFVRNPTGISHAPQEAADAEDIDAGVEAMVQVVEALA